jgi:15-cis-phytoene synthase
MSEPHDTIAQMVRKNDPDRYFSALFAPAEVRPHLLALYAFNHEIARVAETVRQPLMGEIRLEWWRETLQGAREGTPRNHVVAKAMAHLLASHRLPVELFDAVLDARRFDSSDEAFADWTALESYCDATSGNLMRLAVRVLGGQADGDELAREAGIAYAMAGLIRALPFHAARHKVYLPQDLLAAVGLSPEQIMTGNFDVKVKAAVVQASLKARRLRIRSALLPAFLPAALVPLYLKRAARKSYDPLKRTAEVPQHRKQMALLGAAFRKRL